MLFFFGLLFHAFEYVIGNSFKIFGNFQRRKTVAAQFRIERKAPLFGRCCKNARSVLPQGYNDRPLSDVKNKVVQNDRIVEDPEGIVVEVPDVHKIIFNGIDKQLVGSHAALIRDFRRLESYKGKGVKYENEHVRRKVGKTGK